MEIFIVSLESLNYAWGFYQFVAPEAKEITGKVEIAANRIKELTKKLGDLKNFKSQLQETWQKQFQTAPKYQLVKSFGPDHNKTFIVKVFLKRQLKGEGRGKTKQAAEQAAAKSVIISLCLKSN